MKTTVKKSRLYILLGALLSIGCLVFAGWMSNIHAETASYTIYGKDRTENSVRFYITQDNIQAYCFDANRHTLHNTGNEFYPTPETPSNEVSYLMLHCYPVTTYINGTNHTPEFAQLITQVAVWMFEGYVDLDGSINAKSENSFTARTGTKPDWITAHGNTVVDAASSLVKDARKNGPSATIPDELKSKLYIPADNSMQRMLIAPRNPWGRIQLTKTINLPEGLLTDANYDITQINFEIYKGDTPTGKAFKIKPDSKNEQGFIGYDKDNPTHDYINIQPGFYSIRETNVPVGIIGSQPSESVYLGAYTGSNSVLHFKFDNNFKTIEINDLIIKKGVGEQGDIPLKGAEFEVVFTSGSESRKWILQSDEQGKVKLDKNHLIDGDSLYELGEHKNRLPLGKLTIKEIKAPEGYALSKNVSEYNLGDYINSGKSFEPLIVVNKHVRANIRFVKKDGATSNPLAYVPFKITNTKTNESHIIVTDANGLYDSSVIEHAKQTNANDTLPLEDFSKGTLDLASTQCGLWFEGNGKDPVDNEKGSLPYGTYVLEELRGETNKGYELISTVFEVKGNESLDFGELLNWKIGIHTKLMATPKPGDTYVLEDTISYTHLPENKEYTVITSFIVLAEDGTSEKLLVDGAEYTQSTKFTPDKREGDLVVESTIPKSALVGKTIVAFEEIYDGEELIASHTNPLDAEQTVVFEREKVIQKTGIEEIYTSDNLFIGIGSAFLILLYIQKRRNVF